MFSRADNNGFGFMLCTFSLVLRLKADGTVIAFARAQESAAPTYVTTDDKHGTIGSAKEGTEHDQPNKRRNFDPRHIPVGL